MLAASPRNRSSHESNIKSVVRNFCFYTFVTSVQYTLSIHVKQCMRSPHQLCTAFPINTVKETASQEARVSIRKQSRKKLGPAPSTTICQTHTATKPHFFFFYPPPRTTRIARNSACNYCIFFLRLRSFWHGTKPSSREQPSEGKDKRTSLFPGTDTSS